MADTLAEIYRNTLTSSSFDSNGEATIVTTNSSTSHVIKNIQVSDTDTQIPVNGTLQINDFDIVGLTANSSGSEIIAPSSTVKVKSSSFPLSYLDYEFANRTSGTNYQTQTVATVNGITALPNIYAATNTFPFSNTQSNDRDTFCPNLGSNNYHLIMVHDNNAQANMYLYDGSGNAVVSKTASYEPKWFDGKQYVYFHNSVGTHGVDRIDCYTGTVTRLVNTSLSNGHTYPKMFGYKDEYLFFWSRYDTDNPQVYSFADGTLSNFANNSANNALTQSDRNYYAVKRSGDRFRIVIQKQVSELQYYDWTKGTVLTSTESANINSLSLSGNDEELASQQAQCGVIGSRFYYINAHNKLSFIDFEPDTPTKTVVGTNNITGTYGKDIHQIERTPSNSTINARSYGVSPSLKLRVTGITST